MKSHILIILITTFLSLVYATDFQPGISYEDGTFRSGTSKLHTPVFKSMYLTLNDTLKVPITDVSSFNDDYGHHVKMTNINRMKDFATLQTQGKLNLYTNRVAVNTLLGTQIRTVVYFSETNDELYKVDYARLRPILSQTKESQAFLDSYNNRMKTANITLGIGIVSAIAATTFALANEKGSDVSPPCICISLVSFFASYKISQGAPKHLVRGIQAYNQIP